jgi:hypothetical protein
MFLIFRLSLIWAYIIKVFIFDLSLIFPPQFINQYGQSMRDSWGYTARGGEQAGQGFDSMMGFMGGYGG